MGFKSLSKALSAKHMSFMRLCLQAYKSHRSQFCGVKPISTIATPCETVAVMVSYDSILHGDEVCRQFFGEQQLCFSLRKTWPLIVWILARTQAVH